MAATWNDLMVPQCINMQPYSAELMKLDHNALCSFLPQPQATPTTRTK